MKDVNRKRLEALEWAMEAGYVIAQDDQGFFIATGCIDEEPFSKTGSLRTLAGELARLKARMEAKP